MTAPPRPIAWGASLLALLGGCQSAELRSEGSSESPKAASDARILGELRAFEASRRATTHFLELPPSDERFGANPYAVAALSDGTVAGVLEGSSELVWFDLEARPTGRASAPDGPVALTEANGRLLAVGRRSRELWVYDRAGNGWRVSRRIELRGIEAAGAVATGGGRVFVAAERPGRLLSAALDDVIAEHASVGWESVDGCRGPSTLRSSGTTLALACVLDHEIVLFDLVNGSRRERARFTNDGPFWGVDVRAHEGEMLVAAVGAEDHPLDRRIGSFGNVDSYLYLFRAGAAGSTTKVADLNLSELGVVLPKAVAFVSGGVGSARLFVAAAGSPLALWIEVDATKGGEALRVARRLELPPGSRDVAITERGLVLSNPLLDAFVFVEGEELSFSPELRSPDPRERLGEALAFTTLMAPFNRAEGPLSRFTCETCHYEGKVDGRVHHTGRADIHAATKPLFGLFNNRPHFSRALDRDLSKVAHAEFRVAGQNSGRDPVFSIDRRDFPWLERLGLDESHYGATELRSALMAFLMAFTPPSNARTLGRTAFSDVERRGAALFLDACETCHQARASTDDASSRVSFEQWEALIFAGKGAIVWASPEYQKTGVEPYVHERGARTPSLRRLSEKRPYFTNGSAPDLDAVLERARRGDTFSHAGARGSPFDASERSDLQAFLELL